MGYNFCLGFLEPQISQITLILFSVICEIYYKLLYKLY